LFNAGSRREQTQTSSAPGMRRDSPGHNEGDGAPFLEASDLRFCYPNRAEPVLKGCNLQIRTGDRILVDGISGAGKSTLAALLSGLRVPQSGLVLLEGLDLKSLGHQGWRTRISSAPQFHENHLSTGTLGFNLLIGRRCPPGPRTSKRLRLFAMSSVLVTFWIACPKESIRG